MQRSESVSPLRPSRTSREAETKVPRLRLEFPREQPGHAPENFFVGITRIGNERPAPRDHGGAHVREPFESRQRLGALKVAKPVLGQIVRLLQLAVPIGSVISAVLSHVSFAPGVESRRRFVREHRHAGGGSLTCPRHPAGRRRNRGKNCWPQEARVSSFHLHPAGRRGHFAAATLAIASGNA